MKKLLILLFLSNIFIVEAFCQAIKVELKSVKGQQVLYRDGAPFYIKGAAGINYMVKLKSYGGNSIRLWNTDNAGQYLDSAHKLGLAVTLGVFLQAERMGFDYNNTIEVQKQKDFIRSEVMKYKDHPALLMWGIGNEVELGSSNPKVWHAINDISKMIHELDSNHLTTTMLAGVPLERMPEIIKYAEDLDILSVNAFKDLPNVPDKIAMSGWKKPYIISEFGSDGYWETQQTKWKTFYESTSTEKAKQYRQRYQQVILANADKCLGSYVFFWGQKQERTHTYFSMFLEEGKETESIDVMQFMWTGKWPDDCAPQVKSLIVNNKKIEKDIYLKRGSSNTAIVNIVGQNNGSVKYYWELYYESTDLRNDGKGEEKPDLIMDAIDNVSVHEINFKAPDKPGAYRLFVTLYKNNKVATANMPFYVN